MEERRLDGSSTLTVLTCLLLVLALGSGCGADSGRDSSPGAEPASNQWGPPESIYQRERRIDVRIDLNPGDWDRLRAEGRSMAAILAQDAGFEYGSYFGNVTVDGTVYEQVELKKKGFIGSLSMLRPSLRLDFERGGVEIEQGLRRLTLNAEIQDPSRNRECMAYDLLTAASVPVPRCAFAHLVVNGEDLGTYVNVEPVRKPMLRRHFASDEGNLYEGTVSDFTEGQWERLESETNREQNDRSDLRALVTALNGPDQGLVTALRALIDLDQFRDFWALETLLGHWDGYSENANNYYLYHDPSTDKLVFIPWGVDQAFTGASPFSRNAYEITVYAHARLTRRLYDLPEQRTLFRQRLGELNDRLWDESRLLRESERIAQIAPDADPDALARHREFLSTHGSELRAALAEPAPEIVDPEEPPPPGCQLAPSRISGSFSISGLGKDSTGSAQIALELDGTPIQLQYYPSVLVEEAQITLGFYGELSDGRWAGASLIIPRQLFSPGKHPFHAFETFGVVGLSGEDDEFTLLGLIGDGTLTLDAADPGGSVRGRFDGINYQSACLASSVP